MKEAANRGQAEHQIPPGTTGNTSRGAHAWGRLVRPGRRIVIYATLVPPGEDRHVIAQDFGDPVSVRAQVLAMRKRGNAGDNDGAGENPDVPVSKEAHASSDARRA
jgi:hypothetical protein